MLALAKKQFLNNFKKSKSENYKSKGITKHTTASKAQEVNKKAVWINLPDMAIRCREIFHS